MNEACISLSAIRLHLSASQCFFLTDSTAQHKPAFPSTMNLRDSQYEECCLMHILQEPKQVYLRLATSFPCSIAPIIELKQKIESDEEMCRFLFITRNKEFTTSRVSQKQEISFSLSLPFTISDSHVRNDVAHFFNTVLLKQETLSCNSY